MNIEQLCDRYNIKSRKSLYNRLEGLQITLAKEGGKSYATEAQLELLDEQDKYLKNGGTIKNFVPATQVEVSLHNATRDTAKSVSVVPATQQELTPELLENIVNALTPFIAPQDPLWYMPKLEVARASGWLLTTSQVKDLIGVAPTCKKGKKTYRRGCFIFVKSGKIGRELSWKVKKITDDENKYSVN